MQTFANCDVKIAEDELLFAGVKLDPTTHVLFK